jgi:PleD family two-component response regulator
MERLREMSEHNLKAGEGPVIAAGIAKYDPSNDSKFEEVFERADRLMYKDKRNLKGKAG